MSKHDWAQLIAEQMACEIKGNWSVGHFAGTVGSDWTHAAQADVAAAIKPTIEGLVERIEADCAWRRCVLPCVHRIALRTAAGLEASDE